MVGAGTVLGRNWMLHKCSLNNDGNNRYFVSAQHVPGAVLRAV